MVDVVSYVAVVWYIGCITIGTLHMRRLEATCCTCHVELFIEVSVTCSLRACHFPLAIMVIECVHHNQHKEEAIKLVVFEVHHH